MKPLNTPLDIQDNNSILLALTQSNAAVFEQVYRYYFRGLVAFCSQYVSQSEAEEIVQDTMMWLWEYRTTLNPDYNLKSLLFTIVKNKAINRINHHRIKEKVHQEIVEKYEAEFESPDFYVEKEIFTLYNKAIATLPQDFREVYELNRTSRLTHKEIAAKMNVSPQTVNYRISQVLKTLRTALKDYIDGASDKKEEKSEERKARHVKSAVYSLLVLIPSIF